MVIKIFNAKKPKILLNCLSKNIRNTQATIGEQLVQLTLRTCFHQGLFVLQLGFLLFVERLTLTEQIWTTGIFNLERPTHISSVTSQTKEGALDGYSQSSITVIGALEQTPLVESHRGAFLVVFYGDFEFTIPWHVQTTEITFAASAHFWI